VPAGIPEPPSAVFSGAADGRVAGPRGVPGDVGGAVAPPTAGKQPNRRLRLWLAMAAGIVALLCLGGAGVVVSLYDSATEIKRTSPDAVVDGFLRAYLVNRDDKETALYTCKTAPNLTALADLRSGFINRERKFAVKVTVSWSSLRVSGTGENDRSVATDLIISGTKNGETLSRRMESWTFDVVDEDGWRVCNTAKVS
jgi:hypothetical protein